jgi:membrane-associated phospholipid phosphatase
MVLVVLFIVSLSAQTPVARQELLASAQIWRPTDVASMNLRIGAPGPGAFAPGQTVRCDYLDRDVHGKSPKFRCRIPSGDDVKVKFGDDNGEVFAEVAATRLLWALGFGADRVYPVRVVCRGCPEAIGEPGQPGERVIELAAVERPFDAAQAIPGSPGWSWSELDLLDERAGGAPRAHRDALKLIAAFLQHTDTKPEQQRLACLDVVRESGCAHPFLMLNDVGLTFGRATLLNSNALSSMNHRAWVSAPVWKYATSCVANLPKSLTGTLRDPIISEEGRQFLAGLLLQLSDAQLRDLFDVARAGRRVESGAARGATATTAQWVAAFKAKRASIANRHCADGWSSQAPILFTTSANRWLQSWASPRLTAIMEGISLFGYTPFYVALAMFLAFMVNIRAGASLLVLLVLTNVITGATKVVASYPRPDAVDAQVAPLAAAAQFARPPGVVATPSYLPLAARDAVVSIVRVPSTMDADDAYGFPSGHVSVSVAFLCGLVFLFGWRGAWLAALIWIPLMALSRMYLGRHFLGDVIGGVAVGLVATMVVVRGLNLQRLAGTGDRRVVIKTVATAAACVLVAYLAAVPPMYDVGRLTGAVVALLIVNGAPRAYDDARPAVRMARLAIAIICSAAVWWATKIVLSADVGEPLAIQAFVHGAVRMAVLIPVPMIVEAAVRRFTAIERVRPAH